ncbi:MAG TPA: helix-turn-helix transcriptional regulator [Ktedonobacteraceae bacterium]|nr:helix-turn-helix transcriptional regulator [Ktedonobacteraceae bacterium]
MIRLKVKEIAERRKISMTRLSRIADVNYKTVRAMFFDPHRDVAYSTLLKVARALDVRVEDLAEEVPDEASDDQL